MKRKVFKLVVAASLVCLVSFSALDYKAKRTTSEVEQIEGLSVFIHSKPVLEYDYVGTFAPKMVPSKDAKSIINHMIKKGKEKYPTANGIIFTDDELSKIELIIIK